MFFIMWWLLLLFWLEFLFIIYVFTAVPDVGMAIVAFFIFILASSFIINRLNLILQLGVTLVLEGRFNNASSSSSVDSTNNYTDSRPCSLLFLSCICQHLVDPMFIVILLFVLLAFRLYRYYANFSNISLTCKLGYSLLIYILNLLDLLFFLPLLCLHFDFSLLIVWLCYVSPIYLLLHVY